MRASGLRLALLPALFPVLLPVPLRAVGEPQVSPATQAAAEVAAKTVLAGVYSPAQASRGQHAFEQHCARCHKADLSGLSGPPLAGSRFMDRWREFNLNVLADLARTTMPRDAPGTLSEQTNLDVLAYILQVNGIPSGNAELSAEIIPTLLLVGKDGPQPLPTSALVDVVGCATLETGTGWFLTRATEPRRTLDVWIATPEEAARAERAAFGALLFRLENVGDLQHFDRDAAVDHKVEVKGTLVRQPNRERVNVTMIQVVGGECAAER